MRKEEEKKRTGNLCESISRWINWNFDFNIVTRARDERTDTRARAHAMFNWKMVPFDFRLTIAGGSCFIAQGASDSTTVI